MFRRSLGRFQAGTPPIYTTAASRHGLTLLEVMIAMMFMAVVLLGFIDTLMQSRRLTEGSVLQMTALTAVTGLIEQMKMLDYDAEMPITTSDGDQALYDAFPGATAKTAPYARLRLNQDQTTWLQCVNNTNASVVTGPNVAPASTSTLDSSRMNTIGPLALSSISGARSQALTLRLWIWIDAISGNDVAEAKCITVVYAYPYNDGRRITTVIKRDVFVRTPFGSRSLN